MRQGVRDFLIGATAIIGVGGLGLTLFLLGELKASDTYPLRIELNTASGLYRASPVTINGVRIGEVTAIAPADDPRAGVILNIEVAAGVRIPRQVDISIDRNLVGDASLTLKPRGSAGGPALTDADFLKRGDTIVASASTMFDQIGEVIDSRFGSITGLAEDVRRLSTTWTRVGERAEALLTPVSAADVDAGKTEGNAASAIARIDKAAAAVQAWLGDDNLRSDARRAVSRASEVFDKASEAVDTITRTAQSLGERAGQVGDNVDAATRELVRLSASMGEAVEELRGILGQVNAGQGTVGQLVKNPDLYNALTDAARRLEKALTEAQLIIEKYRKEGIPIRF